MVETKEDSIDRSLTPNGKNELDKNKNKDTSPSDTPTSHLVPCTKESALTKFSLVRSHSASALDTPSSGQGMIAQVIGPTSLIELVAACPCCTWDEQPKKLPPSTPSTVTTTTSPTRFRTNPPSNPPPRRPAEPLRSRRESLVRHDSVDDSHDDMDVLPGVLAAGVHYSPRRILAEGWLHKKGTGQDWLGSRAWKARWARLCLASVDGYDFDIPLLLIYWYAASATASTVINLDATVVLSVDAPDATKWNAHRFEVRHVSKSGVVEVPTTRTFSAPQKGRDAWVYAISQALLFYEKHKDKSRKQAFRQEAKVRLLKSQNVRDGTNQRTTLDDVWTGDRFVKVRPTSNSLDNQQQLIASRVSPSSPRLPRPKRPNLKSVTRLPASILAQPSF